MPKMWIDKAENQVSIKKEGVGESLIDGRTSSAEILCERVEQALLRECLQKEACFSRVIFSSYTGNC